MPGNAAAKLTRRYARLVRGQVLAAREREFVEAARALGVRVRLPVDLVVAPGPDSVEGIRVASVREMPRDLMGLDIGPRTEASYAEEIRDRSTTVAMHLLRRLLRGEGGGLEPDPAGERARA